MNSFLFSLDFLKSIIFGLAGYFGSCLLSYFFSFLFVLNLYFTAAISLFSIIAGKSVELIKRFFLPLSCPLFEPELIEFRSIKLFLLKLIEVIYFFNFFYFSIT